MRLLQTSLAKTRTCVVAFALAALPAVTVFADIIVTPPHPHPTDVVTIRVESTFGGSPAQVTSTSVSQSGNTFTMEQAVTVGCIPPPPPPSLAAASPAVGSEVQVGPLAAGTYSVIAHVNITGCSASFTQTSSFIVSEEVPMMGSLSLAILAGILAVASLLIKR
jgi:hypothetical protein